MKKSATVFAGVILAGFASAQATTILDTNFDNANKAGTYTDGSVINSSGSAAEQVTVRLSSAAQAAGSAVNVTSGQLQFVDNATTDASVAAGPSIYKDMTSAGSIGYQKTYDYLSIKFDLTTKQSGTRPKFQILVNDGTFNSSSSANAVFMMIDAGGNIYYNDGSTGKTGAALATNTTYSFQINVDYAHGTWDLIATPTTGAAISLLGLQTRATVNTSSYSAGYFVMNGGANGSSSVVSDTPYITIDNLSINASTVAVPEPAALALLPLGSFALLRRRSTR